MTAGFVRVIAWLAPDQRCGHAGPKRRIRTE